MPAITAILHTHNDELRLGRALETARPCDEILVVDHGSVDATAQVAREYGATICAGLDSCAAAQRAHHPWLLFLLPNESISEALEASLFEWKLYLTEDVAQIAACSLFVREESAGVWSEPLPETRLVPRSWSEWEGFLPRAWRASMLLQGDILRFREP